MSEQVSLGSTSPRQGSAIALLLLLIIIVPATLTLRTVESPGTLSLPADPTPYGYTVSLLLWIVPSLVIAFWLLPHEHLTVPRRAFAVTIALLFPLGAALDYFFAHLFFTFPNANATLGIHAPAYDGWVPVEEYIFYITGFVTVLLLYIWFDEFWLSAYKTTATVRGRVFRFHLWSLVLAVVLVAAGIVYKKFFSGTEGFPGYYTFLVLLAFIPAITFLPVARPMINWRAFSATMFFVVLVSLLWEATLASPYGWWRYQPDQMLGIFVKAWSWLPVEAVFVWISVTYSTVITYHIVTKIVTSSEPLRFELFGPAETGYRRL